MSPADAYLEAVAKFERASARIAALSGVVGVVRRATAVREGVDEDGEEPDAEEVERALKDWPSGAEIGAALQAWDEAVGAVHSAWEEVPSGLRRGLRPPEEIQTREE
ncbi:MAG: hypothetical protein JNJ73_14715 [Hyphomonadaceae bacterium]|nr:hypothetical protein [Hyphomonadaceae bacterium]